MDEIYRNKLESLLKRMRSKPPTLFLGSGFSIGAKNIKDTNIPTVQNLCEILKEKIPSEETELQYIAEDYEEQIGGYELCNLLKELFTVKSTSDSQQKITKCTWNRVYTTNYDNAFEVAATISRKNFTPVVLSNNIHNVYDKTNVVIHINGFIDNLNVQTLHNEFKLNSVSYSTDSFSCSEYCTMFRQDIEYSNVVLFVGFSLRNDLDIKRIIAETNNIKEKCFFIVKENESTENINKLEKYGTVLPIGFDSFVNELDKYEYYKTKFPKLQESEFLSFEKYKRTKEVPQLKDEDVFNLLMYGEVKNELISLSLIDSNYKYYINRQIHLGQLVELLKTNKNNFIIISRLGNGKSMFLEGVKFSLANLGYNVFSFNSYIQDWEVELESICKIEKAVLIVENYSRNFKLLKKFKIHRNGTILILTERNNIHEALGDKIETILTDTTEVINIDKINTDEANNLISILDHYSLWGYDSKLNTKKKTKIISDCDNEISSILLRILKSKNIIDRYKNVFSSNELNAEYLRAIIFVLLSTYYDFHISTEDVLYICDNKQLFNSSFRTDKTVRDFVRFDTNLFVIKSSILAEYILKYIISPEEIYATILNVIESVDKKTTNLNYKPIFNALTNFTSLQSLFQESPTKINYIINIFERAKNLSYCRKNPQFWLQYAIARIAKEEYAIAKQYLGTAYSYASQIDNYDTFMIDNHYARVLLESLIQSTNFSATMDVFKDAHTLLYNSTFKDNTRDYPYRVAILYEKILLKFRDQMKYSEKSLIKDAVSNFSVRLEKFKKKQKTSVSKYIRDAEESFSRVSQIPI